VIRSLKHSSIRLLGIPLLGAFCLWSGQLFGQEAAGDPEDEFSHLDVPGSPADPVARLQQRLAKGTARLKFEPRRGYLTSLLKALQIPVSSQALVF